jgi:S1-C subfamily serine protease
MSTSPPSETRTWQRRLAQWSKRFPLALPFGAGVVATLLALLLTRIIVPPPPPLSPNDVHDTVAQMLASVTPAPSYSSQVYRVIRPSLVLIQVTRNSRSGGRDGLGSGVIINNQGDVLTSLHVVEGAETILLTFADGSQSRGHVINEQPEHDIAVLQAETLPEVLIPAVIGSANALRIGDEAFVVGHPLGLYGSMSAGIISGFDRSFQPRDDKPRLEGLIQIDAAVNPGNSGGPLLNRYGHVVGIVTGLANPTDQDVFIGIGFAVPIGVAGGAAGLPPY